MTTLSQTLHDHVDQDAARLRDLPRPPLEERVRDARRHRRAQSATLGFAGMGVAAAVVALGVAAVGPTPGTDAGTVALPYAAELSLDGTPAVEPLPAGEIEVVAYVDPLCPACGAVGEDLLAPVDAREGVTVRYRPIALLDSHSADGTYSTRAANALQEVALHAPDAAPAFVAALWREQPEPGATASDDDLVAWAVDAGVPTVVAERFSEHRYEQEIADATAEAIASGLQGVPWILVDGALVDGARYDEPDGLDAAIAAAG